MAGGLAPRLNADWIESLKVIKIVVIKLYKDNSLLEPILWKNSSVEFDSTLEYWPVREAKIGHVAALIGQFQLRVKHFAGIM